MSTPQFGHIVDLDEQPALFTDLAPAKVKPAKSGRTYQGGQAAMMCSRCFDMAGPFVRSREGYAYCLDCARLQGGRA